MNRFLTFRLIIGVCCLSLWACGEKTEPEPPAPKPPQMDGGDDYFRGGFFMIEESDTFLIDSITLELPNDKTSWIIDVYCPGLSSYGVEAYYSRGLGVRLLPEYEPLWKLEPVAWQHTSCMASMPDVERRLLIADMYHQQLEIVRLNPYYNGPCELDLHLECSAPIESIWQSDTKFVVSATDH